MIIEKTTICKGGKLNPKWNEILEFVINNEKTITFTVYNIDKNNI